MFFIPKLLHSNSQSSISFHASPNVGEFKIASSINSLNASKATSSLSRWRGRNNTLEQVLLLGRTSSQNLIVAFGRNPKGGTSSAPVANTKIAGKVTVNLESSGDVSYSANTNKIIKFTVTLTNFCFEYFGDHGIKLLRKGHTFIIY